MFEQMVKEMHVPPEILVQLTDEQRDVLHYEIRQEQIRRYNDWQKIADASSLKSSKTKSKFHKKKKEKRVTFSEGPDGTVMVNKVYLDDTNGYAPGTLIPRIDRRADGSYWTNKQTIDNNQRIYISDDSDYIHSWVPVHDYSNVSRNARPETRPVSIVRILDDLDDHSSGMSQSSPSPDTNASIDNRSGGCQQKTSIQGVDNVLDNSGDQNKNSLRIKPWPQIDSNETSDVENVENTGTITMPTSSKKPSEFSYVREISISDGSTPEMQRREPQPIIPTKNVSHDSRSLIVLERPSECNHDPPESTIRGSVISKPPYVNNSYSNGNQNESASHRTIYVNGINKSFVTLSTDDMMGDSDSSESDIQPSSLQRFPRLSIEDRNSASFFRIRELPSPQSTPSLPRRVLSSQTLHLKQPAQRDTNTHVITMNAVEQQAYRQNSDNSATDPTSVALKHRVAPEILRRTEQLYRYVSQPSPPTLTTNPVTSSVGNSVVQATTPLIPILMSNSATKITDTTANTTMRPGGSWFRRSEAANLMRDFSLPATGFDTARPDQTFSRVPRWFHGTIDRSRAEQLLRQVDLDGAFLVRVDPLAQRYVISVLWAGQVSHILVSVITPEPHLNALGPSYQLYGLTNVDQFSSLRELVQYYASHPLTTHDHQLLLYAVGQTANLSGLPDYADLFYPPNQMDRRARF